MCRDDTSLINGHLRSAFDRLVTDAVAERHLITSLEALLAVILISAAAQSYSGSFAGTFPHLNPSRLSVLIVPNAVCASDTLHGGKTVQAYAIGRPPSCATRVRLLTGRLGGLPYVSSCFLHPFHFTESIFLVTRASCARAKRTPTSRSVLRACTDCLQLFAYPIAAWLVRIWCQASFAATARNPAAKTLLPICATMAPRSAPTTSKSAHHSANVRFPLVIRCSLTPAT